jgi:hypothetical protein
MHVDYIYQTSHASCAKTKAKHFNIRNQVARARIKHQFYKELSTHYNTSCLQKHPTHHTSKSSLQLDQQQKHNALKSPRMYKSLLQLDQQQK